MTQASDTAAWRFLVALGERPFPSDAIACAKAPALGCRQCGRRIELKTDGTPLVIAQPVSNGGPVEERIRALGLQRLGLSLEAPGFSRGE